MSIRLIYPENRKFDKDIQSINAADIKQLFPKPHIDQKYNISLILPMYNVASYIIRCLKSVFNQIDINIQVIIVNDGSTDESLSIALNYLSKHESKNTIIISQQNRGLSAARNIGTSFAVSKYIAYLDTDDFIAPDTYTTLYNFAVKNDLDLVLFRAMIFNSFNLTFSEFHDAYIWDSILEGQPNLITDSFKTPELLMLQPSANTKLIRRAYFLDNELFFPVGLVFEDYPIHVKGILGTEKIGLLGSKFYIYRVNRPGKITDENSTRRFDSLQIFDQTVNASSDQTISPEQGMSILYSLITLTYWCGTETVLSDRMKFFSQLSHKFSSIPNDWIDMFKIEFRNDLQLILLCALRKGEIKYLFKNSIGSRNVFRSAFILIQQRCYRAFFSQSYGYLKNKIKILQKFSLLV